jgi:hypothetical protein
MSELQARRAAGRPIRMQNFAANARFSKKRVCISPKDRYNLAERALIPIENTDDGNRL